jgi:hypothetical protein
MSIEMKNTNVVACKVAEPIRIGDRVRIHADNLARSTLEIECDGLAVQDSDSDGYVVMRLWEPTNG